MGLGIRLGLTGTAVSGGGGTTPPPTGPLLLIVAGQSNSRTAGNSAATPNAKYTSFLAAPNMQIVVSDGGSGFTMAPYTTGFTGANSDSFNSGWAWGSELEFVYQMRQDGDNRTVYVVKHGVNGQDLATSWNPATPNDDFQFLQDKVTGARAFFTANGITIGEEVALWCQGEKDADDESWAAAYEANFIAFMAAWRTRISATSLFITERVRQLGYGAAGSVVEPAGFYRAAKVREAQIAVSTTTANMRIVSTDFEPRDFAQIHPTEPWTEGKGLRGYRAYKNTYNSTYIPLTDTTPDAFSFAAATGATPSSVVASAAITLSGFERRSPISVTGGEYRILNATIGDAVYVDWTSASGFIDSVFFKVQVRGTASASNSTTTGVTLTVGGVSSTFDITTEAAGATFEAETTAFLATVTANGGGAMNGTQKAALDALYVGLKADGLMTGVKLPRLYIGSIHDIVAARVNLRDQSTLLAFSTGSGGNMPWSTAGWNPTNVSQRGLNMQFNPVSEVTAGTITQNSCGVFTWIGTMTTDAEQDMTSLGGANPGQLLLRINDGNFRVKIAANSNQSLTRTNAAGFYCGYRSTSTLTTFYGPAGTSVGTSATASAAFDDTALWYGHPSSTTSDRPARAFGVLGQGVTATDIQNLRNRLDTFFTAFFA